MPEDRSYDKLRAKVAWRRIQWEVAKEIGLVDDSRQQMPVIRSFAEAEAELAEKDSQGLQEPDPGPLP